MIFGLVKTPDPKSLISGTSHISIRLFNKTFFEIVLAVPEILRYTQTVISPNMLGSRFIILPASGRLGGSGKIPGKVCGQYTYFGIFSHLN